MDSETLDSIAISLGTRAVEFRKQKAYAKGRNPLIYTDPPRPDPDMRIPIPFCAKAVSFYSGYMGKPGAISYSGDFYEAELKTIYTENDEQMITSQEFATALTHGECYELHWVEAAGAEKQFYPIPPDQAFPMWSEDLKPRLTGFVYMRVAKDGRHLATVYDDITIEEWVKPNQQGTWLAESVQSHGYGQVPVAIGKIDCDCENLFDKVIPLVDLYDKLASGQVANEAERYNASLLLFAEKFDSISKDEDGRTMVDRLREFRMIDGMGEEPGKKVSYLVRNIPVEFIKFCMETIERLIYETLPMPNPSDDTFATASGIAQKYKLLGLEYKAASIEMYWKQFLLKRIELLGAITGALSSTENASDLVEVKFSRNLPQNLVEIADIASKVTGILSQESVLRLFPSDIVPDVEAEMDAIEEEAPPMVLPNQLEGPPKVTPDTVDMTNGLEKV